MSSNTNLGNTPVNQGYVQLIHTGETGGIDGTLRTLYDGDGTASDLQIASNKVKISTELYIGSKTITEYVQDVVGDMFDTNGSHTNITATYDDNGDGAIDLVASGEVTLTGSQTLSNKTLASPTFTGDINFTDASTPFFKVTDTTNTTTTIIQSGDNSGKVGTSTNHNFNVVRNNVSQILLQENFLIINNPGNNLDVNIKDSSANSLLRTDAANSRVGILDATPSYTLDVNGTGRFTGALQLDSTLTFDSVALSAIQTSSESFADNDTSLMTSAAINDKIGTEVASLVDSAPSTLDTLNELAAALGDDPNFATTTATSLGEKLVKASNLSDLTNAATARSNLGVDAAGTDNSTNVTLAGSLDYLTLSGQQITRNAIDLTTDVTGVLPSANLDADTAHLSGTQTFSGAKTFSSALSISNNAGLLNLIGTDHAYIQYYPDGTSAGRKAYVGFGSGTSDHFYVANEASDGDMFINVKDGTSTLTAIRIDSSAEGRVRLPNDNQILAIGASQSLKLYHLNSTSVIKNITGGLQLWNDGAGAMTIKNTSNNQDMFFNVVDDSQTKTAIRIDASDGVRVKLPNDNQKLSIGESNDLEIFHDSSHTWMQNKTGNFLIRNQAHGSKLQFGTEDSSGTLAYVLNITGDNHRVGIGTTSPSYLLHLSGTAPELAFTDTDGTKTWRARAVTNNFHITETGAGDPFVIESGAGANAFKINSSGNVGIGTNTPDAKLEVVDDNGIHLTAATGGRTLIIKPSPSGAVHEFESDNTAAGYQFSNNSGVLMKIQSDGKVGIGANSPGSILHLGTGNSSRHIKVSDSRAMFGYDGSNAVVQGGNTKGIKFNTGTDTFGSNTRLTISSSGDATFSGVVKLQSELDFTGNGNKIIDVETLEGSNSFRIRHHNPVGNQFEDAIRFNANGGALIYYNGSNKLETTNTGVSVTGALSVSGALSFGSLTGAISTTGNINTSGVYQMDGTTIIDSSKIPINIPDPHGTDRSGSVLVTDYAGVTSPTTSGWYTIASAAAANARGGGIIGISFTGGYFSPRTFTCDFQVDWSGNLIRCEVSNQTNDITKVRIIETGSTTELQAYFSISADQGENTQTMRVTFTRDKYNPNWSIEDPLTQEASPSVTGEEINGSGSRGVKFYSADTNTFEINNSHFVFNELSKDVNFRVESNGDANMLFVDGGNNRVGIGTGSPDSELHISNNTANLKIESTGSGNASYLHIKGTTNQYDLFNNAGDFQIDENGVATRFIIKDSTGNVGISETSPDTKLHIKTTGSGSTSLLKLEDNARLMFLGRDAIAVKDLSNNAAQLYINSNTTFSGTITTGGQIAINDTNAILYRNSNDLEIRTYGGYDINLMAAGNVGIGQTSPSARLDVVASGNTGIEVTGGDGYLAGYFATSFDYVSKFVSTDASAAIVIEDSNSTSNANRVQVVGDVMELVASNSKRIELSSGSVVINQDSDNVNFRVESNGNQNMLFVDGGNDRVGIGTTSPAGTLHVEDSDGSNLARFKDSDSSYAGIIIAGDTNGGHIGNSGGYAGEGIYFQDSAEVMRFYAAGGEKMRLTGTGRLGIGTSSPDRKLHVQGSAIVSSVFKGTSATGHLIDLVSDNATDGYNGIRFYETTNHRMSLSHIQTGTRGYMQIGNSWASGSEILVVDGDNQRVGIGTTSPGAKLDVDVAGSNGGMRVISSSDSKIAHFRLAGGSRELLQIGGESDSVSKVQIGTSATSAPAIEIDSSDDVKITESLGIGVAASSTTGRLDCSNDVVAFSTSDKRLKENIKPLDSALDKVLQISGVEFDWKELTEEEKKTIHGNEGHDVGVIAQEIEEVLPEVVTTRDSGYKAVKYEKIVPLLIEAIKEQQQQIEELKNG